MTRPNIKPEPAKTSLKLENHQVLLKPLVTEKGMHRSERYNQYSFEINVLATKEDVRRAVESRRFRFRRGKTRSWKKAVVTLRDEHRIDFF